MIVTVIIDCDAGVPLLQLKIVGGRPAAKPQVFAFFLNGLIVIVCE